MQMTTWSYLVATYKPYLSPDSTYVTKWPQNGWSSIFGATPSLMPSQLCLANQIAAWSRIYQNHVWIPLVLVTEKPKWKCCETFVKYLLLYRIRSQSQNIHNPKKNVYTLRTCPKVCVWFLVDTWPSANLIGKNLIGQNYLAWHEAINQPKDTRPPFPWPFC